MPHDFRLTIQRDGRAIVVTVTGEVGPMEAIDLRHVLHDLVDGQGNLSVVLDLSHVGPLSGEALNVIAGADHKLRQWGQRLEVRGTTATTMLATA